MNQVNHTARPVSTPTGSSKTPQFLDALQRATGHAPKKTGSGWEAHCPAHDDRHPSLSVTEKSDKLLMHCRAGCETKDIVEALNLQMSDLFFDDPHAKTTSRIVAEYNYIDADGGLLYQVVRFEPKNFKQRRPDPNGGWFWRLNGVVRVPYNLPDVREAAALGKWVFVAEGEKDCDRLTKLGLTATTGAGGAGKWRQEYDEHFTGAKVAILSDNDAPGRKHAQDVARHLQGIAETVRVVELPDLPVKGDVSDWIDAGGTTEALRALVNATAEWAPGDADEADEKVDDEKGVSGVAGDAPRVRAEICTDAYTATMFAKDHSGDVCWVPGWGWMLYDGTHWCKDTTGAVGDMVESLGQRFREMALGLRDTATARVLYVWAKHVESQRGVGDIMGRAQHRLAAQVANFDTHPMLLNFQNGTLDFDVGTGTPRLRPHDSADRLTHFIPHDYDPAAKCPRWEAFVEQILPQIGVRSFVQRAMGYSVLGFTVEQCFFLAWGSGANGKSVFLNSVKDALGRTVATQADPSTLMASTKGIRADVARLCGARLVCALETGDGNRLDETLIKGLCGGDPMVAEHKYQAPFEFVPTFALWLGTNHRPAIRGTDLAIWRRVRLMPFDVTIPEAEQDRHLQSKLADEAPGILRWIVDGTTQYLRDGLKPPTEVLVATEQYRSDEDVVGQFLDECTVEIPNATVGASELFEAYQSWSGDNRLSQTAFGRRLTDRGVRRITHSGRKRYADLGLRSRDGL